MSRYGIHYAVFGGCKRAKALLCSFTEIDEEPIGLLYMHIQCTIQMIPLIYFGRGLCNEFNFE